MTEPREPSQKDTKLSALYQQAEKAEPSARLDTLIQSAAHDAVKKTPHDKAAHPKPSTYPQRQSWFALAAMIALVAIALPIMLDESDQILFEPDLQQRQPSSGKLTEKEAGTRPSVADAVLATPASAPAAALAAKIAPAPEQKPKMELHKASPEKKARRKRLGSMQTEQANPAADVVKEDRQEAGIRQSKQKAYSDQKPPAISGFVAIPLEQTATVWQDKIRKLLQDNQLDKARTELKNLQKAWPGFQVDPVLLRQAGLLPVKPDATDP